MTAPDESGINKDCTEKSTDWIATDAKRCTDVWILVHRCCWGWTPYLLSNVTNSGSTKNSSSNHVGGYLFFPLRTEGGATTHVVVLEDVHPRRGGG